MIVPGMFMALAVGFMMLLAMFIPWVDRLESDRVVGLLKRLGEGLVELSGRRGGDCYFVLNLTYGRAWSDVVCRTLHLVRYVERMASCPIDWFPVLCR